MALPITVPYTFGNATTAIPLSNLDSDYATVYQAVNGIGNGSVALANVAITGGTISGNTTASNVTVSSGTFTNVTLSNVTISSVSTPITAAEGGTGSSSAFTTNGVVYASSTSALATGSALTFDGTNWGLGVTPSAWSSSYRAIETGSGSLVYPGSATNTQLWNNLYLNSSGNVTYKSTGIGGLYSIGGGGNAHSWYYAASGTAGTTATLTQAMTLDVSGNFLVGTTTLPASNRVKGFGAKSNTTGGIQVYQTVSNSDWAINATSGSVCNYYSDNGTGLVYAGNISVNGSVTTFNSISDQRLKENIQDADSASSLIDSLQVRQYDWKSDNSHQRYGFIAQELVTVAPEAVHQPTDTEQMMAVDYSKLVPMLVKEIQSLRKRILTLENK